MFNALFANQQIASMVEFSTFKALVSDGQIKHVRITEGHYAGFSVTAAQTEVQEWRTVRVEDPGFVALLDQNGVEYFGVPQGNRPLLGQNGYAVSCEYSTATQQYVDEETTHIIPERYDWVLNLLREQREAQQAVAARLLETEVVESAEFTELASSAVPAGRSQEGAAARWRAVGRQCP